ncbi:MAG: DUF1700 domain-containing protein [Oscillospiraceae bacterium]|jgi:uncharacterized membrane protein|nr:DUF1700 domain-containing protein [Oscillospiraceae bacterium]
MTMTRNDFLPRLRRQLRALPREETDAAIAYYADYISDAGGENEAAVIAELGSPGEVAAQILASFAVKPEGETGRSAKKGISTAWFVILAIFASPIALPLALAFGAVVFALFIALLAVVFSFGVTGAACVITGVLYAVLGILLTAQSPATAVFCIGGGLFAAGLGLLFVKATLFISRKGFGGMARFAGKFILRRSGK